LAVRDSFTGMGIPLGYMQIDSWWYPKGPYQLWTALGLGTYTYTAAPAVFPDGLGAFQQALGLPIMTHARWIDPSSPYVAQYKMSNHVSIDPAFWSTITDYIQKAGTITYEQDWLNQNALPRTDNLTDQDAFMDNMAKATNARGLSLQYCMPLPRHYLQGAMYDNLLSMRVSEDHFMRARWTDFLYGSRLAGALSAWPWADVFMSSEEDNLIVANLSGGMLAVGDAIGTTSKDNLLRAVRPDGIIVKPDVPLVPIDQTFIHGAQVTGSPVIASTYSDFGGLLATYVFAYTVGPDTAVSFAPAALGYSGKVYVYNYFLGSGKAQDAAADFTDTLAAGGRGFYLVVPIGPSGIAFLGDAGKYVALGKQRVAALADSGTVSVTLNFASGEGPVTVHGHAQSMPVVTAMTGSAGPVSYDPGSQLFSVSVSPTGGTATLTIH
jgi:hypothetical protein